MGHKVDTLFSKIPEEFRIFYTKSMRYKDIDSIALYLISCLMLMYGIVSTSQASATGNKVQDEFFGVVETKAIENKAPAFATEATSRLIKRSSNTRNLCYSLNDSANWHAVAMDIFLHSKNKICIA
ncbi:MAG: hypothetical protein P8179_20615 [Candidatus Thiodiazotropha sp.]|jgi:hypothetical protein